MGEQELNGISVVLPTGRSLMFKAPGGLDAEGWMLALKASQWQRPDILQGLSPTWVPDTDTLTCFSCQEPFKLIRWRYHCRACGRVFCKHCVQNTAAIPSIGYEEPVRTCESC